METEIEAKWLDIDKDVVRKKLADIGAVLKYAERKMIRQVYDYPDKRLEKVGGWVRVRNEGNKITLSYKQLNDRTLHGTKEVSVTVENYDATCNFLEAIGLICTSTQETMRESWKIGDTEIEIDSWPWIPSFVEIEAKDENVLFDIAGQLDLDAKQALHGSVEVAYQAVYNVTEAEVDGWENIRFSEVPEWLTTKRK